MPRLTPAGQVELLDLLLALPATKTPAQREALLFSLPASIVDSIDLAGDRQSSLVTLIETLEYWGQLADGRWATEVMLLNAIRAARNTQFESKLEAIRRAFALPASAVTLPELPEEIASDISYLMPVGFLGQGQVASRAVARICVPQFFGGTMKIVNGRPRLGLGTGWLIASTLLVTNRHVVAARFDGDPPATPDDVELQAQNAQAWFDYVDADAPYAIVKAIGIVAADATLDYAILRLDRITDTASDRACLMLASDSSSLTPGVALNIIQHPGGIAKQIAIRRNDYIGPVDGDADRFCYLTDTLPGSSGSPVFNDKWEVVGLHRGSRTLPEKVYLKGEAIKYNNVGVRVEAILRDLPPEVRAEIEQAQKNR